MDTNKTPTNSKPPPDGGTNISDRDARLKCDGTSAHPHEQHDQAWPRFWVMEGTDAQNPLSKMNPFLVSKGIQGISQSIKVRRLRNGSLLLTCDALNQARTLKKITRLGTAPVKVTPHKTMNSCQGIIRCREISDMSEEDIKQELASQGITKVKQFTVKKDGQVRKTSTFLLTFNSTTLPQSINVGYLRVKVEVFIPNPLRCYQCQRYGHGKGTCRRQPVCFKCGKPNHDDNPCTGPLHCVNCAGNHSSNSKQCPLWVKECAIQKVKVERNLPYNEARRVVEASAPLTPSGGTYASVAAQKVSVSIQTDISCFPLCKKQASPDMEKSNKTAASAAQSPGKKPVSPDSKSSPASNAGTKSSPASNAGTKPSDPVSLGKKNNKAASAPSGRVLPRDAAANSAAAPKGTKSSGAVSPTKNLKEAEKAKVKLNRNGSRTQKGSNDPIRDGVAIYEEELDPVSSSKRSKGKNKSKS